MSYFSRNNCGFTLVELLVSIGIVAVILTVVVLNRSTYTDSVALANLADEIGLTMSQAQAYGIGVRELSPGSSDFSASYGLTFSLLSSGSSNAYLSFADRNDNQFYDGDWSCPIGGASECLEKILISRGNYINQLCRVRNNPNNPYQCSVGRIDISFARPSPEAQIKFFNQSGNLMDDDPDFIGARVSVCSPGGASRSIVVYYTGQVSINSSDCSLPSLPPLPTVSISANPNPVSYNSSATLTWSSTNATSCSASDAWHGTKAISGSQSTGNLTSNQTYTLTCTSPGGSAVNSVTVTVGAPPLPTVSISASPNPVSYNSSATLTWSSTNATSCSASDAWYGTKATSSSQSTGNLTSNQTYTLTCTGPGGSAVNSVTVTVGAQPAPILTWTGTSAGSMTMTSGAMKYFTPGTYTVTVSANVALSFAGSAGGAGGGNTCLTGDGGGGGGTTGSSPQSVTLYSAKSYSVRVGSGGNQNANGGDTYLYNSTNAAYIIWMQGGQGMYGGGLFIGSGGGGGNGGVGGGVYENGAPGGSSSTGGGGGSGGSCDWGVPGSGGTGGLGGSGANSGPGTSGGNGSVNCYNQTAGVGGGGWSYSGLPAYYGGGGGGGGACGTYGYGGSGANGVFMFKAP